MSEEQALKLATEEPTRHCEMENLSIEMWVGIFQLLHVDQGQRQASVEMWGVVLHWGLGVLGMPGCFVTKIATLSLHLIYMILRTSPLSTPSPPQKNTSHPFPTLALPVNRCENIFRGCRKKRVQYFIGPFQGVVNAVIL